MDIIDSIITVIFFFFPVLAFVATVVITLTITMIIVSVIIISFDHDDS